MSKKLNVYTQCLINSDNTFKKTELKFRARNTLAAAKKAYRKDKNQLIVYILDENEEKVHAYNTENFFKKKKPHKKTQR